MFGSEEELADRLFAYRERFQRDFLIDLIGYRRHGHNEGDEPAYTQPKMYERIRDLPTVRQRYATTLAEQGVLSAEDADARYDAAYQHLLDLQRAGKGGLDYVFRDGVNLDDLVAEAVRPFALDASRANTEIDFQRLRSSAAS